MTEKIRQLCGKYMADAVALRRELHANPEIGMDCPVSGTGSARSSMKTASRTGKPAHLP